MVLGMKTAVQVEQLLRKAARRADDGWTVKEVPGDGGRKRGKGAHKLVGLYDGETKLAWTTIPQHPGDLAAPVVREIEATFEPFFGKRWMDK
jgi:hypothetical protein